MNAPPIQCRAPDVATVRGTAGVVDVWQADLARVEDRFGELLCAQEFARAARILPERKRVLWARSRGVLRALLGRYLDHDPRTLRFVLGPHGKPALLRDDTESVEDLRFNLSHSGSLALYAVTVGRAVGIDVEVPRRRVNELAVAERVLGAAQAQRLGGFDSQARARELLRAWVLHEAVVKCRGVGLATPLESPHPVDLWTAELDVGPPAAAAVAVAGGPCELCCYLW
jgi:4'-phosphopantetheinyl transferase